MHFLGYRGWLSCMRTVSSRTTVPLIGMRSVFLVHCASASRPGETCFSRRRLAQRLEEHNHRATVQRHQHSTARRRRFGVSTSRVRGMLLARLPSRPSTHRCIPASARGGAHRLDACMSLAKQPRQSHCRTPWTPSFVYLVRPLADR